jgi:hypothetical protein
MELEPLLKRKPLSLQYYLYEALEAYAATISHLEQQVATEFPPVQQLYEPFGVEFMRYSKWEVVDRNLEMAEMGMEPGDNEYQTNEVEHESTQETIQPATNQSAVSETETASPSRAHAPIESESAARPSILSDFTENRIPGFSSGSTKWNRKEGTRMMTPPHKQIVSEPLTDFQVKMMGKIYCKVVSKQGVNTIPETAKLIVELWNEQHFALLFGNIQSAGYGGVLTPAIVEKRLTDGHDAQVAAQGREDDAMRSLIMMPNPFTSNEHERMDVESHVLMHNPPASRKSPRNEPETIISPKNKKQVKRCMPSNKAPPLYALSEENIQEIETGNSPVFTAKVLQDYCREINQGIPSSKQKRAEIVIKYWRSKNNANKNI